MDDLQEVKVLGRKLFKGAITLPDIYEYRYYCLRIEHEEPLMVCHDGQKRLATAKWDGEKWVVYNLKIA